MSELDDVTDKACPFPALGTQIWTRRSRRESKSVARPLRLSFWSMVSSILYPSKLGGDLHAGAGRASKWSGPSIMDQRGLYAITMVIQALGVLSTFRMKRLKRI